MCHHVAFRWAPVQVLFLAHTVMVPARCYFGIACRNATDGAAAGWTRQAEDRSKKAQLDSNAVLLAG